MPLIIITGLPSSGKTYRAQQILADLQTRISSASSTPSSHIPNGLTVQYLPSFHASLDATHALGQDGSLQPLSKNPRDVIYNSAREEKTARAEEFSAVKRALSKNNIVIADAPNYIKGFRYQMWCEAKAAGTRSVVVHTAAREDECQVWNEVRAKAWGWGQPQTAQRESDTADDVATEDRGVKSHTQPESHTAIYGDRATEQHVEDYAKSSTSSMGEDFNSIDTSPKNHQEDSMTLKSLYISEHKTDQHVNGNDAPSRDMSKNLASESQNEVHDTSSTTTLLSLPSVAESLPYSSKTLESLSMRYEPPSPFTRWDTPLFTVPSSDIHPPYQAIWDALFPPPVKATKRAISQLRPGEVAETKTEEVRRHAATILPRASSAEALQTLETATADVVKALLATVYDRGITTGHGGDLTFSVPNPKGGDAIQVAVVVPLNTMLSQPALQRLRRKFTQIQRAGISHGQGHIRGRPEIIRDFSRFMEAEWNVE